MHGTQVLLHSTITFFATVLSRVLSKRPSCFHFSPGQVEFPPDLCSRVTFVNFTVTRGSLQSQCLNQVLKAERPDVDAKRSDLLKLQGLLYMYVCTSTTTL